MTRVGCVPYLNARPLVAYLERPEVSADVAVVYDTPSRLAASLRLGELDVALVSSYEALLRPGLEIVPDVSISTRGRVLSVRLFSKVPFEEIQTLALDQSSLTSSHLAQLLLAELHDCCPMLSSAPPDLAGMLVGADAGLLIGDAGMAADGTGLQVLDLGEAWTELTGLPFVWAAWIGENLPPSLCGLLLEAKGWGHNRLVALAEEHARRLGWEPGPSIEYLTEIMDHDLTPLHLQGLELFQALCIKHGILENLYPLRLATGGSVAAR